MSGKPPQPGNGTWVPLRLPNALFSPSKRGICQENDENGGSQLTEGLGGPEAPLLCQVNPLSQVTAPGYLFACQTHFPPPAREAFLKKNDENRARSWGKDLGSLGTRL